MRPDRYRNAVVPHIYVEGAANAIGFYERAFGAEELFRIAGAGGRIVHAEISIAGSVLMIGDPSSSIYDEPRRLGACTAGLHLLLDDNVAVMRRAVEAGCEPIQPPTDMFYGANSASVRDPFGHVWVLLSWKEDLAPAEMERRAKAETGWKRGRDRPAIGQAEACAGRPRGRSSSSRPAHVRKRGAGPSALPGRRLKRGEISRLR